MNEQTPPRVIGVRTRCGHELIEPKADRTDIDLPSEKQLRQERLVALLRYDRMRQAARLRAADRLPPAPEMRDILNAPGPRTGTHPMAERLSDVPMATYVPPFRPVSDLENRMVDAVALACFLVGGAVLIWAAWELLIWAVPELLIWAIQEFIP